MAARTSAPGGGVVAATTLASAAALTRMAAAFAASDANGEVVDAGAAADRDRADELARRALELADADAPAYAAVLAAEGRDERRVALLAATEVPLEVVEVAREVALLAAPLADGGRPALRGDAGAAALLASAAARAAAHLVRCNVDAGDLDPAMVERAEGWARDADRVAAVGDGS